MSAVHLQILPETPSRPTVRGGCAALPRPCPFPDCRFHLAADSRDREPFVYSCALDAADDGAHTPEEIAEILGITAGDVRAIEERALAGLRELLELDAAEPT